MLCKNVLEVAVLRAVVGAVSAGVSGFRFGRHLKKPSLAGLSQPYHTPHVIPFFDPRPSPNQPKPSCATCPITIWASDGLPNLHHGATGLVWRRVWLLCAFPAKHSTPTGAVPAIKPVISLRPAVLQWPRLPKHQHRHQRESRWYGGPWADEWRAHEYDAAHAAWRHATR